MMPMTFSELRQQYPKFVFRGCTAEVRGETLFVSYDFEIPGLCRFAPKWEIPCRYADAADDPAVRRLILALGMTELISYWKAACPPVVEVQCMQMAPAQSDWWKQLYFGGLGEFFYRNGIETTAADFMEIVCTGQPENGAPGRQTLSGKLIPVGGGKDSIVTLNLLRGQLADACAFQINHRDSAAKSALLAGIPAERMIECRRTLDSELLRLNKEGFLNGHTPFSAVVAFSAVLTAYVNGLKTVILSNESSASESTVSESEVNHQYSKSYQFECDFARYEREFLRAGVEYFSLLRPLTEFQIARYFAALPTAFHEAFRSCNAGNARGKKDMWCGKCAKCLFVSVILSPFLPYAEICRCLSADLLNDPDAEPWLMELCGALPNKPFECVGSRNEVNIAVCLAIARMEKAGETLPLLYQHYKDSPLYAQYAPDAPAFGQEWDDRHNLPGELAELVKRECVTRFQ